MPGFVHLHTHSEYSLLDGAARLDALVKRAAELEMPALALTDHGAMYGAVEFHDKCRAAGIKPVIGVEAYMAPGDRRERKGRAEKTAYHLLLLARNLQGYRNLLKLTTIAAIEGFYYKPRIDRETLALHAEGLISSTTCLGGEVCSALLEDDYPRALEIAAFYRDLFGAENYYVELQDHTLPAQRRCNEDLLRLARDLKLPVICTNDIHYLSRDDANAHDVLLCIGTGATIHERDRLRFEADEFYMKSSEEMAKLFRSHPEALERTLEVAGRCELDLEFGKATLPAPGIPAKQTPNTYLRQLALEGLESRLGRVDEKYRARLDYELDIIEQTGFAQYFLIVRDFSSFSRTSGIFFGVRGSAAGSLTSFSIGITDIDPVEYELTFERFLNPERVQMPDIDMDFEDARRGEVIDYVTKKYGEGHVAQIVTFGTLGARAAIRDAGRALAMPLSEVNRLAGMIPSLPLHVTIRQAMEANADLKSLFRTDEKVRNLCETAMRLEGLARHASVHAAGVVISNEPLVDYTPLQRSADGGLVTQYPASTLEKIGLLKMDFLGLINLSILGKAVAYIEQTRGERIDVQRIPLDDSAAFELLGHGVTTGIFQLESAGMRRYVTELKPSSVRDLAAMVALYRPGPMAHIPTFIRAKHGLEDIKYPHPSLEGVLEETYGVIVYQDQVMRIAQEIAGYTLGQADLLRRAMGKKKKEEMAKERSRFLEGAAARGIPAKKAGEIFDLIEPFAGYAFNKAHAVCYAMIAYQTAYLKARYPVEYMAALMSCYIERADKLASCLEECRRMKIEVRSPDVNLSGLDFQPEGESIRFGLVGIKNVGRAAAERVMGAREEGPYLDLDDFCARVSEGGALTKATVEALVHCGAFDGLGESRQAMAEAVPVVIQGASRERRHREAGQFSLFVENGAERATAPPKRKYAGGDYASPERLAKERELLGVYLSGHPLQDVAVSVRREANCTAEELRERGDGEAVTLAGIVSSVKPFRSKRSGEPMAFITIEDMTGAAAVTVFPSVFRECESAIQKDRVVVVRGRASCRERVIEDTEGERNVEVLADEVRAVVAPASGGGSAVHIHLSPNVADRLRLVRSALEESPGAMPVFLYVPFGEEVRKVAAGLRVSPGDLLTRRLEELVGSGAVSVA